MDITVIRDVDEFEPWRAEWQRLAGRRPWNTAFHQFDWIAACLEADCSEVAVSLITEKGALLAGFAVCAFDNPGPAFLARTRSLSLEPRIGTVRPGSMIALIEPDRRDLPVEEALRRGFAAVRWQTGFFQYCVDRDGWLVEALERVGRECGYRLRRGNSSPEAYMSLVLPPDEYLKTRSPKLRDSLRNSANRLAKAGPSRFVELCGEGRSWEEIYKDVDRVHARSWQRTSPASPLAEPYKGALAGSCRRFWARGLLRAWFLYLRDQPIAFEVYFLSGSDLFPVVRGIDEDFKEISPGTLLMAEGYRHFHDRGIRGIYYGPIKASEKTAYKSRWATEEWPNPNLVYVKKNSLYGLLDAAYASNGLIRKIYWKLRGLRSARS